MPRHFSEFIAHSECKGLLIVRQSLPISIVADDLLLIHATTEAAEWLNRIAYLPI
jgi:hypothetical protein